MLLVSVVSAEARGPWIELKNCRLSANEANDADSIHVKAGAKEYIFRLYFVDAPETDAGFPERVAEQGKYFGIRPDQAIQLGNYAKNFTKQKLAAPFTVRTTMQDALGRSKKQRFYAFIQTSEGDLGELLVANGMARVHGTSAAPTGFSSAERQRRKLQRLEREAKQQKVGGWGASAGRLAARLPKEPAKAGSSFDSFFHPERVAAAMKAEDEQEPETPLATPATSLAPAARTMPSPAAAATGLAPKPSTNSSGKLDPNTATEAELKNIKGVGPVLAGRIIAARPFKSADDLRRVKGVGEKTYEKIRPHFIGTPAAAEPPR